MLLASQHCIVCLSYPPFIALVAGMNDTVKTSRAMLTNTYTMHRGTALLSDRTLWLPVPFHHKSLSSNLGAIIQVQARASINCLAAQDVLCISSTYSSLFRCTGFVGGASYMRPCVLWS